MLTRTVNTKTLNSIDALLSGTLMLFPNEANNSVIINLNEVAHQITEGNANYHSELSSLINITDFDGFILVEGE